MALPGFVSEEGIAPTRFAVAEMFTVYGEPLALLGGVDTNKFVVAGLPGMGFITAGEKKHVEPLRELPVHAKDTVNPTDDGGVRLT